uniref:Uncharacterized protein n=1 Tax=viral metagenome TaxID=1070528 RepID=A0A6C0LY84_9ZZZZ
MFILDLNEYINKIKIFDYALTKIDVPYNPEKFPNEYAIGKDLDIYVSHTDFEKIFNFTSKYFNKYKMFDLRIITKKNNFRMRMETNNKLHFQIDITINDEIIKNKIKKNNYYILSLENEKIIRQKEIKKNPNKIHHKEWLITHNFLRE